MHLRQPGTAGNSSAYVCTLKPAETSSTTNNLLVCQKWVLCRPQVWCCQCITSLPSSAPGLLSYPAANADCIASKFRRRALVECCIQEYCIPIQLPSIDMYGPVRYRVLIRGRSTTAEALHEKPKPNRNKQTRTEPNRSHLWLNAKRPAKMPLKWSFVSWSDIRCHLLRASCWDNLSRPLIPYTLK